MQTIRTNDDVLIDNINTEIDRCKFDIIELQKQGLTIPVELQNKLDAHEQELRKNLDYQQLKRGSIKRIVGRVKHNKKLDEQDEDRQITINFHKKRLELQNEDIDSYKWSKKGRPILKKEYREFMRINKQRDKRHLQRQLLLPKDRRCPKCGKIKLKTAQWAICEYYICCKSCVSKMQLRVAQYKPTIQWQDFIQWCAESGCLSMLMNDFDRLLNNYLQGLVRL